MHKVTHIRDNRKGFVAHTAALATTNILLSFLFEQKEDKATEVFKRLFLKMFPVAGGDSNSIPDLCGVTNHSDRGYTIGSTTFGFMVPSGCDFTNTVKRIAPFPFVWGMKISQRDPRQLLDERGTPALFVKSTMRNHRMVTCSAFRTGTKNISAVVSTTVHGHQWEGICLDDKQRALYLEDPHHGLDGYLFEILAKSSEPGASFDNHKDKIEEMLEDLMLDDIDILTLDQGSSDWHKARQFSMTSSQASFSFRKAFIIYQQNEDWCNVAKYLLGQNYHERKSLAL